MISTSGSTASSQPTADRLDSWKEIATYLGRQVRTVNLWESTESLPVHRHQHSKRGTVYAFKSEIDTWKRTRSRVASPKPPPVAVQPKSQSRTMIAVLPFEDLSRNTTQSYFRDGLTEELISQLGQASPEELGVIARTTAMHYKDTRASISTIAAELKVDYVLEGSLRRNGDQIRISARLVEVAHQSTLWSLQTYECPLADLFKAQTHVVSQIAEAVTLRLTAGQPQNSSIAPRPVSSEAVEAYLKARHAWNQRTEDNLWKAVHYFNAAIVKDSQLAVAYSGLADAYNLLSVYGALPPHEAMPLAKQAVTRALHLNPNLGEAHVTLADVTLFYDWDWEKAKLSYERAILLNPSNSTAHHYYAYSLAAAGQYEEAMVESNVAHACDPYSLIIPVWKAIMLRLAGNYEEAVASCRKALQMDPHFVLAHWGLGLAYEQMNEFDKAAAEFQEAVWLSGGNPGMLCALGHLQGVAGQRAAAESTLQRLIALSEKRYIPAYDLAMVHVGLRNIDEAIRLFHKAIEERSNWIVTLPQEPRTRFMQEHPQFRRLLEVHACCPNNRHLRGSVAASPSVANSVSSQGGSNYLQT
jgi:TolB-like protein